ncbi:MAG: c-type cytochrome [Candidatus Eremiobacteraeota bacterium]|nr:c-type cytochrome [Candidatus Eremiobacteraeota bacterium]
MAKGIVAGIVGFILLAALIMVVALKSGLIPANADARPGALERLLARMSLQATIARQIDANAANPLPLNDANLTAAVKLYGANCAACHGAADAKMSAIARGLYQRPPQLARHGVEDDPEAKINWIVTHGIRLTGMPAFGATLSKDQIWQLTMLLKHMDSLPPNVATAFKKLPSVDLVHAHMTKQR